MSASFQRPVTDRVWWLTSAYAQWSPDRLHGVEQLSLGGESSVRGFKEQYISGNNGGYLRNELSWSLFSLPYVGTVRAVAALDGGWLHSDRDDPYSSGTLWGGAAGLSRDPENANGSIAPIFDREKEQKRLQEAQVISQISGQMSNIVMTYGETEAMKAARKEHPGMSDAQLRETPEYREVMKGYGTGSTPQMVVQAITGVLGGLNAGNPGQILAGGLNPAVAQLIKQATGDNREANLMAHAVWGALAAQLGGNNAASGAAGAFSGELAARYIIDNYYGGRTDNLSEQERQQISMLATIASGIAGGLAGNSTASAGMGAMAGKNAVENNSLAHVLAAAEANKAGTAEKWQEEQQAAIREACSGGTPVSCETAVAAMGSAMVWPLLPGAAATTSLIGAGANAGIGLLINGEVNPNDVILGYWTGVFTAGTRLWGTMGVNAASGATSSYLKGDDPLKGGAMGGMSSGLGYGAGKVLQGQLDKFINPNWKNWEWVDVGMGISKPMPLDPLPGVIGNMGGSASTEYINDRIGKSLSDKSGDKK